MSHWAAAPLDRHQVTVFAPTLDDSLACDHPVRLFDEVLRAIDFDDWQAMYMQVVGQPPIHPRVMAAGILYGLSLGIRSSRKLEDACGNRVDFMWLMDGRRPDHATFCKFRTQLGGPLKELFRKIGRVGIELGLVTLHQVTLDGTDIRANNSRYHTARQESLGRKLAMLDQQIEEAMSQAQAQDQAEDRLYGEDHSPAHLPRELKDLKRRQEKLKQAMAKLQQMEKERGERGERSGPAVPLADPDARVLPNKGGGHAPNYTSVLAVDSDSGMIVDSQVLGGNDEASTVLPAVQHIERSFGKKPEQLAADCGFNTGANLADLEGEGVEPLMPARQEFRNNPAARCDPSLPVAEEDRAALPMNPQNPGAPGDKAAFCYDEAADRYFCPMGKVLNYVEDKPYKRGGVKGTYRIYECASCAGCPLAARCLGGQARPRRRVCRDEYESNREQMARRMRSPEGRRQYARRSHAAETPFAVLKSKMGLRQFLMRGLSKVRQELCWAATAYNLVKLIRLKAAAALAPAPAGAA